MKIYGAFIVIFLLALLTVPIFFRSSPKKKRLLIVCTTSIIADAVHAIIVGNMQVKTLMGPGVDPHVYRPRESDVIALSEADLIFYNGLHLEGKMGDMFAYMKEYVPTVAVADALSVTDLMASDFAGIYDPHIWHDVSLWMKVVPSIAQAIISIDREHKELYEKNAQAYLCQLKKLHTYVVHKIQQIPHGKRELLTAHDAFNYFGRAYGFEVVGLQGISTDAVVSTRDIQKMADLIAHKKIKSIFLEASIPSKSIEAVQQAVASREWQVAIAPELFSDSLGDETTTADTYCGMIKHNVDVIVDSLTPY